MNFKQIILAGFLFLVVGNVFATNDKDLHRKDIDKKACKYVQEQISIIEKFHNLETGYSFELASASHFLGDITKLASKTGYSYKTLGKMDNNNDVKTWKNWYQENKHSLYWDTLTKSVRLR